MTSQMAERICSAFASRGLVVRRKCWVSTTTGEGGRAYHPGFRAEFVTTVNQNGCYPVGRIRVLVPAGIGWDRKPSPAFIRDMTPEEHAATDWVVE